MGHSQSGWVVVAERWGSWASQSGWVVVAVRRHTCSSGSVVREGSGSSSHSSCAVVTLSTVRIYNCAIVTILI